MADIVIEIELTELNQSGPLYNASYVLSGSSCTGSYVVVPESPVFLPTLGSTANITVDEDFECVKLESTGQCTNSIISGSTSTTTTSTTTTSTTTTSTTTTSTTTTTTTTTTSPCSEWDLQCPSNAMGDCEFDVDCCAGNVVRYSLAPDQDAIACVEAGGGVSVVTVSGIATQVSPTSACVTDCGDVTSTTTTSTTSTTTTSTTTSTTTTTTQNPAECIEYDFECRSGAVGSSCSFSWTDCEGTDHNQSIAEDFGFSVCALSGSAFVNSASGNVEEGEQCYYPFTLEYGSVSCSSVCSAYPGGNSQLVYLNESSFLLATVIYKDLVGTPADANFWTDGTDCRESDGFGVLGTATSC
jgi:hypothetical protein